MVRVAAASSIVASASSGVIGARGPSANSVNAISAAAVVFTSARDGEIRVQRVRDREIDGADQHRRLQRDGCGLAQHQREGAPCGNGDAGAFDALPRRTQMRNDRAQQQREEQHAAECHRLRGDGQAMDDDRQIAEQIDQQRHASMPCDREGHVATGDMAVDRQHLPAHDIGAGCGQLRAGLEQVGRTGWRDPQHGLGVVGAGERQARAGAIDPAVVAERHVHIAGRDAGACRRLALHQDGVSAGRDGRQHEAEQRGTKIPRCGRCGSWQVGASCSGAPLSAISRRNANYRRINLR